MYTCRRRRYLLQLAMLNVGDTLFDLEQVILLEGHMIGVRF